MIKLPTSTKKLNAWIITHFRYLEGAETAFIEFPIEYSFMGKSTWHLHRIIFVTLALRGAEDLACKEMAQTLTATPMREEFLDHIALLFVRRWFEYTDGCLVGRFAFWNLAYNDKLLKSRCHKAEGHLPNEAQQELEL